MNILLLIAFLLTEIGLVTFTLTEQRQKKQWHFNRLYANVLELSLYLVFACFPGIDFSFRYKGLLIILLVRILIKAIFTFINRNKTGRKSIASTVISALLAMCLLGTAMLPAFLFADYKGREVTGSYKIAQTEAILVDESREETFENDGSKREVPVHFYYPEDAKDGETFPLVIFSHGAFGYYQSNSSTYMELASHGYVVVSLDHPYHSFFCKDTDGKIITVNQEFLNDVMKVNEDAIPESEIIQLSSAWLKLRTDDISFVLDSIENYNKEGKLDESWFTKGNQDMIRKALDMVDPEKIGLMGHSLGGASSVELGRKRNDIDAVIDLDGTMLGEQKDVVECEPYEFEGIRYHEKYILDETSYPVPLFAMDSVLHHESRVGAKAIDMPYANNTVLENAVEGDETYIVDTAHMNFTDLPLFAPFLGKMLGTGTIDAGKCVDIMNDLVLKFYDAKLKDMGTFEVKDCYGN